MQKNKPCTIALLALIALSQSRVNVVSATNAINAKCNRLKYSCIIAFR